MRSFSKKSVALIFLATILCGFSYVGIANALTPAQTQAQKDLPGLQAAEQKIIDQLSTETDPAKRAQLEAGLTNIQNNIKSTLDIINGLTDTTETSWKDSFYLLLKTALDVAGGIVSLPLFLGIMGWLETILLVLGLILALAGGIFDVAMHFAIFDMGSLFNTGSALNYMWTLFRDVINISFIFILLYIAISMIIGSWGLKAKATLGGVIVSAILINFSMFFTKVLIDGGNLIAVALYNQFSSLGSFTGFIILKLHFLEILASVKNLTVTGQINAITMTLLQIALITVAAWTFFYGAFLFIARSIALMFLIVTSPIAYFIGSTGSWLKEQTSEWWETFTGQVMVAPVFLFVLLLIFKLLQAADLNKSTADATLSYTGAINVQGYFYYMIVIGLLLAGTKIAKKMSGKIGKIAVTVARVAAVAGAAVLTAGVAGAAVGAGALGAGAAAAGETAGGGAARRIGARLAFSAKNVGTQAIKLKESPVGKFVTGELGEQPGLGGFAARTARETLFKGIKGATDSGIDLKATEKYIKGEQKAEIERVKKEAEKGVKAEADKAKQAQDTTNAIKSQAEERTKGGTADQEHEAATKERDDSQKIVDTLKKEHADAIKEREDNKKTVEAIKKEPQSTILDAQGKAIPNTRLEKAEGALIASETKVAEVLDKLGKGQGALLGSEAKVTETLKKLEEEQEKAQEKIAEEMGIAETTIEKEETDASGNKVKKQIASRMATLANTIKAASERRVSEALPARNKLIADLRSQSSGGIMSNLFSFASYGKPAEKLASEIAATQPGKFTASKESELKKAYKTIKEAYEAEEGGAKKPDEASEKKEPKNPSGGGAEGEKKP
jgi:hypothetical protein